MNLLLAWIGAARPKTLVAAFLPVGASWILATKFSLLENFSTNHKLFFCALLSAIFLQIATNFWNDYFDDLKGSDTAERLGPRRLLQQNLATRKDVKVAALLCNVASFLFALPIFMERGWAFVFLGALCLYFSIGYTGGPFPLAYLGLGEVFVLIFFGWVATYFSYFVITGTWSLSAFVLGTQIGMLSCSLITINNLRDLEEDRKSKKNTLVVLLGKEAGEKMLLAELAIPYLLMAYWVRDLNSSACLSVFIALPLASHIFFNMQKRKNPNQQLAFSALHSVLFLSLWAYGVLS